MTSGRHAGRRPRTLAGAPPGPGRKPSRERRPSTADSRLESPSFPVVGIGASAGGIEAFRQLFEHLPPDIEMGFVVIQHLSPSQPSLLRDTLARWTAMPVVTATEAARLAPGHVYVIPPGVELTIARGQLELRPRDDSAGRYLPIDRFLESLAIEKQAGAIGVILSGTAADGTEGFKAIKVHGGITFAQEPESAQFSGMPDSAIAAGVVDYRLAPRDIAAELVRLSRHPYVAPPRAKSTGAGPLDGDSFAKILVHVRQVAGIDFARYKSTTVSRRIARRMALRGVASLQDYAQFVVQTPGEAQALSQDILVHVTSFFRDPEVFESLKGQAFPEILSHKGAGGPLKLWVPGCATGEEVYTNAIALLEYLEESRHEATIQIFGSDLSDAAITAARAGLYSESGVRGLSEERLRRFFTRTDRGYRISKRVRDLCVFVVHDLTRDPPFAKLDVISCRNVLIYFSAELQQRLIPLFHFALNQPGYLVLGRSESVSGFGELFAPLDKRHRVFAKTGETRRGTHLLHAEGRRGQQLGATMGLTPLPRPALEAQHQADHLLLARYAPPGVIVNDRLEVVQFRGRTGPFLEQPPGQPQTNVLKIARTGLLSELRRVLQEAKERGQAVRQEGVRVRQEGGLRTITLEVVPLPHLQNTEERHYLLLFEDSAGDQPEPGPALAPEPRADASDPGQEIRELKQELIATRQFLQSLIDEHQSTSDDLAGANEELVASNEELQSTNEELESAKEELQSANEELSTVNEETRNRNQELEQLATDLANVLESAAIPMLIVDAQRHIRRFTPKARGILNIVSADVSRPVGDIKLNIGVDDLDDRIAQVIATGEAAEWEVQDRANRWHRIQIRPYRAADGRPDGAVISLLDIDELKRATAAAEQANQSKDLFLATLSHELRTPLSVIMMQAQMLQRSPDAALRRASASIERAAKLQTILIGDLLDISRITAGKLVLDLYPTDLAAVVSDAVELNRAAAADKSLRLEVTIPEGLGLVCGDAARLQQIVSNLLTNAVKFTPPGGCVSLTLARVAQTARIQVSDTGMGIDPAFLPHVFESFSQADSSSTRVLGGLGLGLGIVKRLVEMHHGVVTAESPGADRGATFTVTLPLMPPGQEGATRASGTLVAGRSIAGVRVLVVEDDDEARAVLVEMLTQFGGSVLGVGSAGEGLKAMSEFKPQVLLSDLAMPGEDGFSLIAKVRARAPADGGGVPAVALSALATDQDRLRSLAAGFQMHFAKPIDAARLVAAVGGLAARRP